MTVAESLHYIEVMGCIFSTASALSSGHPSLALWSMSALLTSLISLYLMHRRRELYARPSVRNWLCAGMRVHRAFAIVGMRGTLKQPLLHSRGGAGPVPGGRVYLTKTLLVNSSILPVLLQALVLRLPLLEQAAVQAVVAAIVLHSTPAYCASLAADGVLPQRFNALAAVQNGLSMLVMAATSSSHGALPPSQIPCTVSLAHLVLVFELILPILVVYACDRPAVGTHTAQLRAGATTGASAASGSRDGAPANGSGAPAAEDGAPVAAGGRGRAAPAPHPAFHPCAVAAAVGVALSGISFHLLCTVHVRYAMLQ